MASSKSTFILQFGLRKVLVLHEQCPQYSVSHPCRPPVGLPTTLTTPLPQDVLVLGKSTFASLSSYNTPSTVILCGGSECPWDGNIELTQKAWEAFHANMSLMTIVPKYGTCQLAWNGFHRNHLPHLIRCREARESEVRGENPIRCDHSDTYIVRSYCLQSCARLLAICYHESGDPTLWLER
jgi:hypothetical protein